MDEKRMVALAYAKASLQFIKNEDADAYRKILDVAQRSADGVATPAELRKANRVAFDMAEGPAGGSVAADATQEEKERVRAAWAARWVILSATGADSALACKNARGHFMAMMDAFGRSEGKSPREAWALAENMRDAIATGGVYGCP